MHAVINTLTLSSTVPTSVWERAEAELPELLRAVPGFQALHVVSLTGEHVVLVILASTIEALHDIATSVGNTWMAEHVIPHLASPPDRRIGEVVASVHA